MELFGEMRDSQGPAWSATAAAAHSSWEKAEEGEEKANTWSVHHLLIGSKKSFVSTNKIILCVPQPLRPLDTWCMNSYIMYLH